MVRAVFHFRIIGKRDLVQAKVSGLTVERVLGAQSSDHGRLIYMKR